SIPARSLFVTEETEKRRERELSLEISKRMEALKGVELFHELTEEELRALAARLKVAPFVRGEVLTKQGAEAHWLYIVIKGTAEIHITVNGQIENVGSLGEGEFFGEMGMMMGEPRSATVAAVTDMV